MATGTSLGGRMGMWLRTLLAGAAQPTAPVPIQAAMEAARWPACATRFQYDGACCTDVGLVRDNNEDAVHLALGGAGHPWLAVLADGMGGHACGEVASALAVATVADGCAAARMGSARYGAGGNGIGSADLEALGDLLVQTNLAVWRHAQEHVETTGMGTTLCVVLLAHGYALWAWIGDSRIGLLRNGVLLPLTHDDTVVNRMVEQGTLTLEEAAGHPQASVLAQALGTHETLERLNVCPEPLALQAGDRLVMTSDGVHDVLSPLDIAAVLTQAATAHGAVRELVEAGKRAGSADNLSAVVVDVCQVRRPAVTRDNVKALAPREAP